MAVACELFDNLHPDLNKKAHDAQLQQAKGHDVRAKPREFNVGELVYTRNYGQGPTWLPGEVVEKHGFTLYTVLLTDGRRIRKHMDQLMTQTKPAKTDRAEHDTQNESDPVVYPAVLSPSEVVSSPETGDQAESRDILPKTQTETQSPDQEPNSNPDTSGSHHAEPEPPKPRCSSQSKRPPMRYGDYRTY